MTYLKKPLSEEIKEKLRKIKDLDSHLVSSICTKIRMRSIEKTAQINSFRIEYPSIKIPFSIPKNNGKKMIKEGIKNMGEAFMWGKRNFNPEEIDENFIKQIAGKITPELYGNDIAEYREKGTMIKSATITPPYPEKIRNVEMPWFMKKLKNYSQKEEDINKITSAIFAHLHLVRIHPFVDGNGRTSRMLQDLILDNHRIPLPIIEPGERGTYYQMLDDAVYSWKHEGERCARITKAEQDFYNFMGGKINISLDKVLDSCYNCM